jgi:hypothetical protein
MCIEAMADTPAEIAWGEAIGEAPDTVTSLEEFADWFRTRAIAKYGSEEAARAAGDKVQHEKLTQRIGLLRKAADAGHMPSLYQLAHFSAYEEYRGIPGAMGAEEKAAALRSLHERGFPLAPRMLGDECLTALENLPELPQAVEPRLGCGIRALAHGQDPYVEPDVWNPDWCTDEELAAHASRVDAYWAARKALEARHLAEMAARRRECVDLLREGGFRGDTRAWEGLADYDITHPTPPEVGIVSPTEHYAWLELQKLIWRDHGWEDRYSVPRKHQERLVKEFLSEEERREAEKLAERFVEVLWPRRMDLSTTGVCQGRPQFTSDPDPYGTDLSPR